MQALLAPCPVEQFSHMQHSGDSITFSSCLLMVIQGKALAKDIVIPCLPGVSVPPSPMAHRVRAGAGAALGCSLNQTCPCAGKAPTRGGIQWLFHGTGTETAQPNLGSK